MKRRIALVAAACALAAAAAPVLAQDWPQRTIRMLVGSSPGGGTDAMARAVAEKLGPALNTSVVVENRPGASNTLAADVTAKSTDGHTMVMGVSTAHGIAPHLLRLNYDSNKDLVPVVFVGAVPNVLVAYKNLPANNVAELVQMVKANPGKTNYASSGAGSTQHIAAELFKDAAGIDMAHIPYRGSAPALVDLIAGRVQVSFDTMPSVMGHIRSGNVKPLAVAAAKRNPQIPDVPTMEEAGLKGVEMSAWYGIYMPANTPRAVQERVHAEVNKILAMSDTRARLEAIGADITPMTQAQFIAFHEAEFKRYGDLIRRKNITLE